MTQLDASLRLRLTDQVSAPAREIEQRLGAVGTAAEAGGARSTRALAALSAMEEMAAEEAARLGRELARVRDAGTGSAVTISRLEQSLSRATGQTERFRAATSRVAAEAGGAAQQVGSVAAATASVGTPAQGASRRMADMIGTASRLGISLGGLDPRIQQVANSFAHAGHMAYNLTAFLPPQLLLLVSIAQVIPSLVGAFRRHSESTRDVTEATEEGTRSLTERRNAIRGLIEETERLANIERGLGSVRDQEAAVREAEQAATAAQQAAQQAAMPASMRTELARVRERAGSDATDTEGLVNALVQRRAEEARERGERPDEGRIRALVQANEAPRISAYIDAERQERTAQQEASVARERRDQLREAYETSRSREEEETRFRQIQEAPQAARQRVSDQLLVSGLSGRQRHGVEQGLQRGQLSDAHRRLLGEDRARELLDAQRQVTVAEQQAASARLGRVTFEDEVEGDTIAAPVAERARRAFQRPAVAAAPTAPAREDTTALARFAEDLDRARIRLTIEDERIRVATTGALEVDATSSSTGGV